MDFYAVLAAALCFIPSLWSFHWSIIYTVVHSVNNRPVKRPEKLWSSSLELVAKAIFGARQKLVAATELGEDFKLGAGLYV